LSEALKHERECSWAGPQCRSSCYIDIFEVQQRDVGTGVLKGELSGQGHDFFWNLATDGTRIFVSGMAGLYAITC
jgi:hypothetical protein